MYLHKQQQEHLTGGNSSYTVHQYAGSITEVVGPYAKLLQNMLLGGAQSFCVVWCVKVYLIIYV